MKTPLFSVTKADLRRETFRCPGKGGQNVNKRETGVRYTHIASGAVGHSCTHRRQEDNEREAFQRLANSKEFRNWLKLECARRLGQPVPETPEQIMERVDRMIEDGLQNGEIQIEEIEP